MTTRAPRVAAQDPPSRFGGSFEYAVFQNGLPAVFAASRVKATVAVRKEPLEWAVVGRESFLVNTN
jgi:hypothetical protein